MVRHKATKLEVSKTNPLATNYNCLFNTFFSNDFNSIYNLISFQLYERRAEVRTIGSGTKIRIKLQPLVPWPTTSTGRHIKRLQPRHQQKENEIMELKRISSQKSHHQQSTERQENGKRLSLRRHLPLQARSRTTKSISIRQPNSINASKQIKIIIASQYIKRHNP